jgi:EpsD family peptidyl-prolyl cis-trans isomerase
LSLSSLSPSAWSRACTLVLLGGLSLLAGCPVGDKASTDASQVAATVNGDELSIHQVRSMLAIRPNLANLGPGAAQAALDLLVEQELAAQAARKAGLDKSPDVIQALEVTKREVLAKAFQDQIIAKLTQPDTQDVDRYYEQHPELFAHRKRYTLVETTVRGSRDVLAPIMDKVEHGATADMIKSLLLATRLPTDSRTFSLMSEDLPLDVLPRMVYLKEGQSIGVMQEQGLVVITVVHAEEQSLSRPQTDQAIRAALFTEARRKVLDEAMTKLRKQSKVRFNPPYKAPSASASVPASASASASTAASASAPTLGSAPASAAEPASASAVAPPVAGTASSLSAAPAQMKVSPSTSAPASAP